MRAENVKREGRGMLGQLGGRIKQAVGHLFGHERMHAEGAVDELRGRADVERGKIAERAEGAMQEIAGAKETKEVQAQERR
jgi:uncharacterized protein YjbJ (UPF0337 family)